MKYRLYIDEVGNSHLESAGNPLHRYLSLTGVILSLDYVQTTLHPEMEALKQQYFQSHPDEPLILHRKELVNKDRPFENLRVPAIAKSFDRDLLSVLSQWDYVVITVTIDKLQHLQQYKVWRYDAYHYCLKVLLERYVQWLKRENGIGDVMAESRGAKEDKRLKKSFTRVHDDGSDFIAPEIVQSRLTSKQLKVKPKSNNIAGLQLADLIAHPSFRSSVVRRNREKLPDNFGGRIASILEDDKYYRSPSGKIDGWGRKWLP
jgi:hypothetical protein